MKVFSFGGGVQSTAALVLAARGEMECDAFLFANVGDDSEHPATLRYVHEVAMPYAERHGIAIHELRRRRKDGDVETLYQRLTRPGSRSIGIPVRLVGTGAPANRACTGDFKIQVIANWCWKHGARKTKPAITMLGISQDEWHRARTDSGYTYTRLGYPLLSTSFAQAGLMGMLRSEGYSRMACIRLIEAAGLPVPPKSSCWFCPYSKLTRWQEMRDNEPELFAKACELETLLMARKRAISKRANDGCYFTRVMRPLALAVGDASQPSLFGGEYEDDACESGFCVA